MTSPLPFQAQIRALERAKSTGQFESPEEVLEANGLNFEVGTAEDAAAAAQGYHTEMSWSSNYWRKITVHVQYCSDKMYSTCTI